MSEDEMIVLDKRMSECLGPGFPEHPARDIGAALQVAEFLETKGFSFDLRDLCPKSLEETKWRARFRAEGKTVSAEAEQASVAVCRAVLKVFESEADMN